MTQVSDELYNAVDNWFAENVGMGGCSRKDAEKLAEVFAAQTQPKLTVVLRSFPESNGKRNWTAMFRRAEGFSGLIGNCGGITIARGEYWNRVAFHAEEARFLLGERNTEPFILAYGDDVKTPQEWTGNDPEGTFSKTK